MSPKRIVTVEEPTTDMLNSAFDATSWPSDRQISKETWTALRGNMAKEFAAMLAATPDPGSYVAVPRELLERICGARADWHLAVEDLRKLLTAEAPNV